ncbi:MAG: hypothetical protein CSB47_10540 [Proteobacteria bacterium]|nr:MAG: hypothetical protein CSB47_10540 [Pseudomonadota bacterium]
MKKFLLPALIVIPLIITALFYLWFREGTVCYEALGIGNQQRFFFNHPLINALPSFAHVYAFSLLTWWISDRKYALYSVLLWVIINSVFEWGQRLAVDQVHFFPTLLADYFANGRYSHSDMLAIVLGGVAAYFTITQINKA